MQVRFWGVRGSCPAPITTDDIQARIVEAFRLYGCTQPQIDVTDRDAVMRWVQTLPLGISGVVGSNTSCVEMRTAQGDLFIIDMGSGIRALGNHLMHSEFGQGKGHAHIFLSHFHWDHIQGWPFFKPAYVRGNRFDLWTRHKHLRSRLKRQQEAPFFPPASWQGMQADTRFHELDSAPKVLCEGRVRISSIELDHPSKSYAYRFEADDKVFVYASDGAYRHLDDVSLQPFINFFRNADLVIFDAQFSLTESFEKRSWGHSSAIIGVELACQANVKRVALFHHDPDADDAWLEHLLQTARDYSQSVPAVQRRRPNQVELIMAREGTTLEC
jgi:phosphoribosyl 1,2-cyclic phosphodiesterase